MDSHKIQSVSKSSNPTLPTNNNNTNIEIQSNSDPKSSNPTLPTNNNNTNIGFVGTLALQANVVELKKLESIRSSIQMEMLLNKKHAD